MDSPARTDETTITGSPAPLRGESLSPRLVAISGPLVGAQFPLGRALTVGRSEDNDISPRDGLMSRFHARVTALKDGGFEVEDLGSRNGTAVNDAPVQRHRLAFGDRIRVGETVLLFTHENPIEESQMRSARLELLGRLGAGIAHDFNNLLNAAVSSLDFLESMGDAPLSDREVRACLSDVRSALTQAADLSTRLVGISREHGCVFERIDLSALCREVAQLLRRTSSSAIEMVVEVPDGLEMLGDRSRMHQALMNLCLNARDAMETGGTLRLQAELGDSEKGLPLHASGTISVRVSDDGVGMTPEQVDHAFDPFFSQRAGSPGTGLGLATVLEIVKYHGGRIVVDSVPKQGTTVTVTLPAASMREAGAQDGRTRTQSHPAVGPAEDIHLLVVDDNQIVRRTLSRLLTRFGFVVTAVSTGAEGVRAFEQGRPDVVLLDIDMPGMQGDEVYRTMQETNPRVPIVIMSGHGAPRVVQRRGFDGQPPPFIQKPFDVKQVQQKLREVIESQQGRQGNKTPCA